MDCMEECWVVCVHWPTHLVMVRLRIVHISWASPVACLVVGHELTSIDDYPDSGCGDHVMPPTTSSQSKASFSS